MSKMSRTDHDQAVRDRKLAKLWREGYLTSVIARLMGYHSGSSVRHAAIRLGLVRRTPNRDTHKARIHLAQKHQAAVEKVDLILQKEPPEVIDATMFRCPYCPGRTTDRNGHELCIARKAVAA